MHFKILYNKRMPFSNHEIADILRKFADLLEIHAENPYRIRAYRRAARSIDKLDKNISQLIQEHVELTNLPNIGPGISRLIQEIIKTNKIPTHVASQMKEKPFRNELLQIKGLGKKRIALLKNIGITTRDALLKSIKTGALRSNFSWVTSSFEEKLLHGIQNPLPYEKFLRYEAAELIINFIKSTVESWPEVTEIIPTGSYRRKSELIGNVDWIIQTTHATDVLQKISKMDIVKELISQDEKSISVILRSALLMTFHVVQASKKGRYLLGYTGSKAHVESLYQYAKSKNITLEDDETFVGLTEKEIYAKLGLSYIEPELRENRGEILAAQHNKLPHLICLEDIKGDLHSHTNETDGTEPLEVMVQAAIQRGYQYFAITDHSKRLTITNGLDEKRLLKQIEQINLLNDKYPMITILKSMEVDILEDGSLDLSNEVLKELDIRVCSVHSKFKLPEEKQTERIIRAMDNPYFNILGHMTGRLLTSRSPYPLQIEKIFFAAKERNCFIEINSQPARLDINDIYCKQAKEIGVKMAISSDAHSTKGLSFMQYGVNQARRGWLEKSDVINTRSLADLLKLCKRN